MHTRGDVIAYKKFAKALMKGDSYVMRNLASGEMVDQVLKHQDDRNDLFQDSDVVFTYYKIKNRNVSEDGKITKLVGEQVSRVNPIGYDTLWGEKAIVVRHTVVMVMHNNAWKVQSFDDPVMYK